MFFHTTGIDIYLISESQSITHLTYAVLTSLVKSLLSQLSFFPICEAVVGRFLIFSGLQDKVRKFEFE